MTVGNGYGSAVAPPDANQDPFRLHGRVIVVTGAAQGIGEAIAIDLVAAGATVALCDRNSGPLAAVVDGLGQGVDVMADVFDVRDVDASRLFIEAVSARFGRVDGLVNNAAGGFHAAFVDLSAKGEAALIAENYTSASRLIQTMLPHVATDGTGGSIVNITSIEAHRGAPGYATYAAMKAALTNLSMSLALELAPRMVRVNCVAPDMIPTPGIELDAVDAPLPVSTPLAFRASPRDVALATRFLLSDASRFITGTTIHVDGGNLAAGGWHRQPDGTYRPGLA